MPTKILKKLNPLEGVVAGEKATLDLGIGPTYHKALFEGIVKPKNTEVATLSHIFGTFEVLLDGKTQRQATAVELNALNALMGPEYAVEVSNLDSPGEALGNGEKARYRLPIMFAEPYRKSYAADQIMAWPTLWPGGVQLFETFQITVTVPNIDGATLHAISAYGSTENKLGLLDGNGAPLFNISKWRRENFTYTASGDRVLANLQKKHMVQSMHFFTQSEDPITNIKIKRENEDVIDVPKGINDLDLVQHGINEDALSADRLDVIFDRTDLPDEGLPLTGVKEFVVTPTFASAGAANKVVTLISQVYGPPE